MIRREIELSKERLEFCTEEEALRENACLIVLEALDGLELSEKEIENTVVVLSLIRQGVGLK